MAEKDNSRSLWKAIKLVLGFEEDVPEVGGETAGPPVPPRSPAPAGWEPAEPEPPPLTAEQKAARRRWKNGMPACLLEFYEPMMADLDTLDYTAMRLAMLDEYGRPTRQALDLFAWYGHGMGSWTRYPQYETLPEQFLMEMPLPILVEALEGNPLDAAHLEGAARFFTGDLFQGMRGHEAPQLPRGLREAFLEHVQAEGEAEKVELVKERVGLER